jgi:hypothetical protein
MNSNLFLNYQHLNKKILLPIYIQEKNLVNFFQKLKKAKERKKEMSHQRNLLAPKKVKKGKREQREATIRMIMLVVNLV